LARLKVCDMENFLEPHPDEEHFLDEVHLLERPLAWRQNQGELHLGDCLTLVGAHLDESGDLLVAAESRHLPKS
jgi:hypothetical protein